MVDRDVRKTRRVVRHMTVPRPADSLLSPPAVVDPDPPTAGSEGASEAGSLFAPNVSPVRPDGSLVRATTAPPTVQPSTAPAETPDAKTPLGAMRVPERPNGFPTAALLADHDAEAAELRHQLDELRRRLDERPPPLSAVRKRDRRPLLGVLVVGGTLGAIATGILVPWSNLGLPGGHDSSSTSAAPVAGNAGAPPAARPITGAPLALVPLTAPGGSLPATGPGVTDPGTMMVVQLGPAGTLNVTEQAVLGPRGLRGFWLSLPSTASLGGEVAKLDPTVRNLRVAVNGTPVNVAPDVDGSGWTVQATAERARTVQLSYQISHALVRSRPSDTGRALAVSLPLLGQTLREQGLPLVVRIEGSQVVGVTCPGADAAQMLCGTEMDNGWSATVPASAKSPALLLQLNLN